MDAYCFTEQSYHPAWDVYDGSLRGEIPGKYADPEVTSRLLNEYLDHYVLADQLGVNIMVNEHHVAATCMNVSVTMTLGVLARQTKRARLLGLGSIVSNRPDPVRVAEEYAWVDNVSGGRLEMGLVKGAGWELFASNANPVGLMDRYWEAHDLILEAMSNPERQFSWEGDHFRYREVNLWPRPIQRPHPAVWVPCTSPGSSRAIAQRGHVMASFVTGYASKPAYDAYREMYRETWGRPAPLDRFAYLGVLAVGRTAEEIERRRREGRRYLHSIGRLHAAQMAPPGYTNAGDFARLLRSPARGRMKGYSSSQRLPSGKEMSPVPTDAELAEAGVMFSGEPNEVLDQILAFNEVMGGLGHLMVMSQSAAMSHEDASDNLRLFGELVLPSLEKIGRT